MKTLKKIPKFKSEGEEKRFWKKRGSTAYIDWNKAKAANFPNLKPSTKSISIRLPESLLMHIKVLANRMDIPYQSFIKTVLAEKIEGRLKVKR